MGRKQEEAMSTVPTATIKLDHWWNLPERHGVMFDLAASEDVELREGEVKVIPLGIRMKLPDGYFGMIVPRSSTCLKYGIMMANSVGIIEPDYAGNNDVWGFVAYAVRDTVIERGTRIAQFMPVPMFGDLDFNVVESMPYTDRGGYGSTGERSAGKPVYRDMNGDELHVGDFVTDELMDCYCVMGLNISDGDAYADIGNDNASVKVALCRDLELDQRPHDCDGVPIEVGDVLYQTTFEGEPIGDPMEVERYTGNALFAKGLALPINARACTHREPDSWEKLSEDANLGCRDYCEKHRLEECDYNMRVHILARAKRLAGIEEEAQR